MTPLALLARAQELPPPPEPTGSPEIDTVKVIGVVLVSLGVIVLLALAIRPFVVKPSRRTPKGAAGDAPVTAEMEPAPAPVPPPSVAAGAIIPFPKPAAVESVAGGPSTWTEANSTIAERFNRVVGESGGRRRKLGDRNPARASHDLATAAMHRVSPEPRSRVLGGAAVAPAPPVNLFGAEIEEPTRFRPLMPGEERTPTPIAPTPALPVEDVAVALEPLFDIEQPADAAIPATEPDLDSAVAADTDMIEPSDATSDLGEPAVAATDAVPLPPSDGVDTTTLAALHQVVRDLIYCANAGELLQGFALYSDPYLFRFLDESGLSEEEFRDTFNAIKARPRDAWDHLDQLSDIVVRPDGAIEATASYVNAAGEPSNGLERYRFVEVDGIWMIDDIEPVVGAV
ncbi:MAG: hypothetical protein IT336_08045 [Thermomicrobiales bacterium]|nr:hypothetical protein [Thermomicrobiales bacterium]